MVLSRSFSIFFLYLVTPFSVLAQRHRGSRPASVAPPQTPVAANTIVAASPKPATNTGAGAGTGVATADPVEPTTATETGSGGDTETATGTGSTPSSTGTSGGDSSCSGSGMVIQWDGDVVPFSWSGGSGTTTGCLSVGSSWEGQIAIAGSGGTIFEGNPSGFFDVSYILGYSVPMVCSANGVKSGCSLDLLGNGGKAGTVHKNPTGPGGARDPGAYNGCASCSPWCYACDAPDAFFADCSGSAYVYPYDDGATVGPASGPITCCIGTGCGTTGREGSTKGGNPQPERDPPYAVCSGSSKRSADELEEVFKRYEAEAPAPTHSPSLLPRKRKAHKQHAVAHDSKILV